MSFDRPPNTTLARGLRIVKHLALSPTPCRYNQLKRLASGANDSTLSRLLHDLERLGYIRKVPPNGYTLGAEVEAWHNALSDKPRSLLDTLQDTVTTLARQVAHSAAIAVLEHERIQVQASVTVPESVSVVPAGATIHFEPDHAASLCILHQLDRPTIARLLVGPLGRISDIAAYEQGLAAAGAPHDLFRDASAARPGVCRIATAIQVEGKPAALFLCLTTTAADQEFDRLAEALQRHRQHLSQALASRKSGNPED